MPAENAYPSGNLVPPPPPPPHFGTCLCYNSSNLPCLYSTFHLEYPLVLSRFCLLLQTRAISFLYLKQSIGALYVMVDFMRKGYPELSGTQVERELQNENSWRLLDSNPGPSAYEAKTLPLSYEN